MSNTKYCYWSVCDGAYAPLMEECVRSARAAGIFKEFHVLANRAIEGCETYDAYQLEKTCGLFKLHYLKVGMTRLAFDFFVWVDADTIFRRNPDNLIGALRSSPIHVPLEINVSAMTQDCIWNGKSSVKIRDAFLAAGVANDVFLSRSAFWIVQRDAIDLVYELGLQFWNERKLDGSSVSVDVALGYAMQMLCGNPNAHTLASRPDLWVTDESGVFCPETHSQRGWEWRHPCATESVLVDPAIVHLPRQKHLQLGTCNQSELRIKSEGGSICAD